jgi:hypothetical protein
LFSWKLAAGVEDDTIGAEPELITSRLLPMLFERFTDRDRLVVLDVASGSRGTVDFFAQYNACIHFVDLFSCDLLINPPDEIDVEDACESISRYLQLPADLTFDVCLFWDALHRVDLTVLRGLSLALNPYIDRRTLGYGFGTLYGHTFDHSRYSIWDQDRLIVRPAEPQGKFYAHSQQQLSEHFASLPIQRATLLRQGRLELLLGLG